MAKAEQHVTQEPLTGQRLPLWTAASAVEATGGQSLESWLAHHVSIDSRTIQPGDLFIALRGENFDGHAFVKDALAAGAAAVMVAVSPSGLSETAPILTVKDTMRGLVDLAAAARQRMAGHVVAVTGSVGKTGTKEMLRQALSGQGVTHATEGNLNNHIGLPLTLARMPSDTAYAILEMGMSHAGEIDPLSRLARPDVAIITAIEAVHSEFFDGIEGIADAKAEIFAGLKRDGTAIINADSRQFTRLEKTAKDHAIETILGFGQAQKAEIRLLSCDMAMDHSMVTADILGKTMRYRLNLPGLHQALNSLAVLGAVSCVGGDVQEAAEALAQLYPLKGRGRISQGHLSDGDAIILLDESYNASPAAMKAAFAQLARMQPQGEGRRIAVLGDMLELGPGADAMHADLWPSLEETGVTQVFTVGKHMESLYDIVPVAYQGGHSAQVEEMLPLLQEKLGPNDVVLVKGSFGTRMGRLVEALSQDV